jgi:hypothetical protein
MRMRSALPVLALCALVSLGAKKGAKNGGGDKSDQPQQTDQPPPAPVQTTVDQHFPGSTVTGYEHDTEGGRQLYFVDLTTSDNKKVTMLVSGRGQYLGQVVENNDDEDVFIDAATAPDPVKAAVAKYYKVDDIAKADLDNLFMEVDESRFIFVAERTQKNVTEWVSFGLAGTLVSVEMETDLKDVPSAVKDAVAKAHPNGKLTGAAMTDEKEKKKKFYTVEVTDGASKLEVSVSPDGQIEATEPAEDDSTKPA